MSKRSDVFSKVKGQMRFSERILAELPGFRGYKEKELRRESDRLVRNYLYGKLTQARNNFRDVYQRVADLRRFDLLAGIDRVNAKFDRVAEKVNHAGYGYSGFFDAVKIKEDALDRMIDFDNKLGDEAQKIREEVAAFKAEVLQAKYDKVKEWTESLNGMLDAFEDTFDHRTEEMQEVT